MRWLPARTHDNGEVRTGNAMILDCYGETLAETCKAADQMVVADLHAGLLEQCIGARWIKSRRPDLYRALIEKTGKERDIRTVRFEGMYGEVPSVGSA